MSGGVRGRRRKPPPTRSLTDMPFEEMFQISKMPEDAFDVHAGAFETATMREIYPEAVREDALAGLEPTFLQGQAHKSSEYAGKMQPSG